MNIDPLMSSPSGHNIFPPSLLSPFFVSVHFCMLIIEANGFQTICDVTNYAHRPRLLKSDFQLVWRKLTPSV